MAFTSSAARLGKMLFGGGRGVSRPRAFDGGRTGRRLAAIPSSTRAINSEIASYGRTVLARSRYLCANDPYMASAKRAYQAALVGTGIEPAPRLDPDLKREVVDAFFDWTDESDATWRTDFYGMQSLAAAEEFEAGEAIFRLRSRRPEDGLSVPLQLQPIPSEMLPLHDNRELPNGNTVQCGIEFDAIGRPVAYHFLRRHPGDSLLLRLDLGEQVRVPADEVVHVFEPLRAGQIRGLPHTLSVIVAAGIRSLYEDNELERKRVVAAYTMWITRPTAEESEFYPDTSTNVTDDDGGPHAIPSAGYVIEPGAVLALAEGEDIKPIGPAEVGGSYEPFLYRQLTKEAAGTGVPYADMTGDLRQTSYGSIRAGLMQFRRRISARQHHGIIYQMCRPIWRRWMMDAALVGRIPITPREMMADQNRLLRCDWRPPRWEWIDPLKDIQALTTLIDNNIMSRDAVIEETGESPEEVDRQIAAGRARLAGLGIMPAPVRDEVREATPPDEPAESVDDDAVPASQAA